ncbi:hypothetical protein BWD08_11165, partial [Neisseria animaloris]
MPVWGERALWVVGAARGGVILAWVEVLAESGALSVCGSDAFATGICRGWVDFEWVEAAKQFAAWLVALVLVLPALEHISRGDKPNDAPAS